jgi:hypothetical protein
LFIASRFICFLMASNMDKPYQSISSSVY